MKKKKSSGLVLPTPLPFPSHPQVPDQSPAVRDRARRESLTQEQQMKTMQKASMMPAMPTTHVSRRKRMTPKMFCRHGRYTPMKVPMRGACQGGWRQSLLPPIPTSTPGPLLFPTFIPLPSPPSLHLISHPFPSLRLHLLSFCLHHPPLHLNPFFLTHLLSPPALLSSPSPSSPRPSPARASFFHPRCFLPPHAPCFPGAGLCSWPGH